MQQAASELRAPPEQRKALRMGLLVAACVVLAGIGSILLPVVPILLGVLLVVAAVIHACLPPLRPYTSAILRAPIARTGRLYVRLSVAAAVGVLLLASGTVGATLRGKIFSQWEQRSQRHEAASGKVDGLLARARESLARGDVNGAEYLLMSIEPAEAVDAGRREEVDELMKRLRRCSDPEVILDILVAMSADDLAALENHSAIPGALDFGDPALTYQAVDTALALVDEARRQRAGQ